MSLRTKGRPLVLTTVLLGGLALIAPSTASAHGSHPPRTDLAVQQVNLVSDIPGLASLTDPDLVNPWGLSLGATTPVWVSNNGTSTSTLYSSAAGATTATKVPTVRVEVPVPTGQVNNPGTGFVLSNGTVSVPARFIFATETGQIAAWSPPVTPLIGPAQIKATVPGAVYKGLAIATSSHGDRLYAANFAQNRIDVFNTAFERVTHLPKGAFRDRHLPKGFAPFNVQTLNGRIFVAYAKVNRTNFDEIAGRGLGFVSEFTPDGRFVDRIVSRGPLNAPWGLAIAPSSWGKLAGSLLVGNFGDGRINVVKPKSHGRFHHTVSAQLQNTQGRTLVIPGLWALLQGTATTGGTDSIWFSAGIDDESHGLLGVLRHP